MAYDYRASGAQSGFEARSKSDAMTDLSASGKSNPWAHSSGTPASYSGPEKYTEAPEPAIDTSVGSDSNMELSNQINTIASAPQYQQAGDSTGATVGMVGSGAATGAMVGGAPGAAVGAAAGLTVAMFKIKAEREALARQNEIAQNQAIAEAQQSGYSGYQAAMQSMFSNLNQAYS